MEVYANALLKDNKIMFWWTGDECKSECDFYKDFYYAGLSMADELATDSYRLVSEKITETTNDGFGVKEEEKVKNWYRQFEIHKDSKGIKPY